MVFEHEIKDIRRETGKSYRDLNAQLGILDEDGNFDLESDKEATRRFFLDVVNKNTVFFHDLEEKLDTLVEEGYYEKEVLDKYSFEFIKSIYKRAYAAKFRFKSFVGAYKYYTSYTLKTFDGSRYLERFEDRVSMTALYLANGDEKMAENLVDEMISGRFQPATPTFLNAGKKQRGELVSCFLLRIEDNMESIGRAVNSALQLSKRGGGVAFNISNIRETGAPIKQIENQSDGIVPVMKILEDSFSYANQLGARQGAGAVYLNVHHPDIYNFLDTKRENADEKVRIKTLSLGLVIPDITLELVKKGEPMYLFSPYDVERIYGKPFSDISITEEYYNLVNNPEIRKKEIDPRELFETIAEIQFESGYPYIMFEDNVNKNNPIDGRINMSNLCVSGDSRILTDNGWRKVIDLYESQEDFSVVSDNRAINKDFKDATVSIKKSSKMIKTAKNAEVYTVKTKEGFNLDATAWHKFFVERDGDVLEIELKDLEIGDKLLVQPEEGTFGSYSNKDLAYLMGVMAAEGYYSGYYDSENNAQKVSARFYLYKESNKDKVKDILLERLHKVLEGREDLVNRQASLTPEWKEKENRLELHSAPLGRLFIENGYYPENKLSVPEVIFRGTKEVQLAFLSGYFQMDSCLNKNGTLEAVSISEKLLEGIQQLLINLGIYSRIYQTRKETTFEFLPDGNGGMKEYKNSKSWKLAIPATDMGRIFPNLELMERHESSWGTYQENKVTNRLYNHAKSRATVSSVEFKGIEDVYDVTVDDGHSVIFNGISTHNCSEILQVNSPSELSPEGYYSELGRDISCNLGSMNIALSFDSPDFEKTVESAVRALTNVSDLSDIRVAPTIENGNKLSHAIGLGQMNLHGFFGREFIHYDSKEAKDFTNVYFYTVLYYALKASNKIAMERGETFYNFDKSKYADGSFFDKYIEKDWSKPKTSKVQELFGRSSIKVPTIDDWKELRESVMEHGIYNQNLQAVPPTGSISYINNSTASIHPISKQIEIRKEGKVGRVYYPAPHMTNENKEYFKDAFAYGNKAIIDIYSIAQRHVDQGLSLTLFYPSDTARTIDLIQTVFYAHSKGIKTIYYTRLRQNALAQTEVRLQKDKTPIEETPKPKDNTNSSSNLPIINNSMIGEDTDDDGCESCAL